MSTSRGALECRGVSVKYGSVQVLDRLDLTVDEGEIVAVLGPSGSGKTSLLAAIAGFVPLESGEIWINGALAGSVDSAQPPESRSVSMVFQNYALWPHLSALENVAYPLRRAGVEKADARREASRLLDRLSIGELAVRFPSELSGGQQQRVGLARALARAPSVYLFDEPTAHLDAVLRTLLQEELLDRTRESRAAALYASHDPDEALAVADRVALLRDGRIIQIGQPRQVYESPIDEWAARLTGEADLFAVEVASRDGADLTIRLGDVEMAVDGGGTPDARSVAAVVRPEWASLGGPLVGDVHRVRYLGARTLILLDTAYGRVWVAGANDQTPRVGDRVEWSLDRVWLIAR